MNVEILLYTFFTILSAIAVSGINFDGIIKKNKIVEARILVMIISISFGYLLTQFVLNFVN